MRKLAVITAFLIIVPAIAIVMLVATQPARRPNLSIRFIGYTNGANGLRLATFRVTNMDASTVEVGAPMICIQTDSAIEGHGAPGARPIGLLKGGLSKDICVPPPTNTIAWTVALRANRDFGTWEAIKSFVMYRLIDLKFRPRYGNMGFSIFGEWVTEDGASH